MLYFRAYVILFGLFVAAVAAVLIAGFVAEQWLPTLMWQIGAVTFAVAIIVWAILWRVTKK